MSVCHLKISSQTYSAMKVFDNKKCRFSSTHFNQCHVASFVCAFYREAAASMLLDHQAKDQDKND